MKKSVVHSWISEQSWFCENGNHSVFFPATIIEINNPLLYWWNTILTEVMYVQFLNQFMWRSTRDHHKTTLPPNRCRTRFSCFVFFTFRELRWDFQKKRKTGKMVSDIIKNKSSISPSTSTSSTLFRICIKWNFQNFLIPFVSFSNVHKLTNV